jgi:hypothetical protein
VSAPDPRFLEVLAVAQDAYGYEEEVADGKCMTLRVIDTLGEARSSRLVEEVGDEGFWVMAKLWVPRGWVRFAAPSADADKEKP